MPDLRCPAVAVGLSLLLAGCAGIPDKGSVHVGRVLPAAGGLGDTVDVHVLPPAPLPGMSASDIVHGFLRAMVNQDGDFEIARQYLTPKAAGAWNADTRVTTYDDSGVSVRQLAVRNGATAVLFGAPRVGFVDRRGDFTPDGGRVRTTFRLVRDDGQWRIDRLPEGTLLSATDATRSFRLASVYYANRTGDVLVPEQVLLRPELRGVSTALVRALLAGPGPWLAPAVRTGFPAGTELLGNVPIDADGVAEVNLSASARQASPDQLRTLSAQLVWTLRQITEISAVRLLADGSALTTAGVPVVQPRSSWASLDPAAPPSRPAPFYRRGAQWQVVKADTNPLVTATGLTGVAMSRDGKTYAGLRIRGSSAALLVGATGAPAVQRLSADTLTQPTFGSTGDVFTVATRGRQRWVAEVDTSGQVHRVTTGPGLVNGQVQSIRLSRDGARVAAVLGPADHGRLVIGRVSVLHGRLMFGGFRAVLPGVHDVRGVAWDGAEQVVVSAAESGGGRELLAVDVNGYSARTISTAGLPGEAVDVAAAPGAPLLVTVNGSIWVDQPSGGWARIGRGTEPRYGD